MNSKIKIIIPYFGITPSWLPYFLAGCKFNETIDWLIYSDLQIENEWTKVKNIHIEKKTLRDFNELASTKLNMNINIRNAYKLCDFKPVYGHIFSDYIKRYDYWGYCDIDIIFGRILNFIPRIDQYDIITSGTIFLSGHFTLYRNTMRITNLYKKIWRIQSRLSDTTHLYYLDELSNFIGIPFSDQSVRQFTKSMNIFIRIIRSLKYRICKILPLTFDITKVVDREIKRSNLTIFRTNNYASDEQFMDQNINSWRLQWKDGDLIDLKSGSKLFYYHFIKTKEFLKVKNKTIIDSFYITDDYIDY